MQRPLSALLPVLVLVAALFGVLACAPAEEPVETETPAEPEAETSELPKLSPDIPFDAPTDVIDQAVIDELSWQTFVALNWNPDGSTLGQDGDNPTVWETYMSTSDVYDSGSEPVWGQRFVPDACQDLHEQYPDARILQQAGKSDDLFEESFDSGPLVDQNQQFARFELIYNQSLFNTVVSDGLYTAAGQATFKNNGGTINFECGMTADEDPNGQGQVGALVMKVVWKMLTEDEVGKFHTSQALIFTPAEYSSTGEDLCGGPQDVGLAAAHIVHKTLRQPRWIWSTFEHVDNVPDCDTGGTCPTTSDGTTYSFFAAGCTDCAACNTAPAPNDGKSYDLDQPAEKSQICRVDSIASVDPKAPEFNEAYQKALADVNSQSVWQNYELISGQWFDVPNTGGECLANAAAAPAEGGVGVSDATPPNLANSLIESYFQGNSSCIDCHGGATDSADQSSDMLFSLGQEVD